MRLITSNPYFTGLFDPRSSQENVGNVLNAVKSCVEFGTMLGNLERESGPAETRWRGHFWIILKYMSIPSIVHTCPHHNMVQYLAAGVSEKDSSSPNRTFHFLQFRAYICSETEGDLSSRRSPPPN